MEVIPVGTLCEIVGPVRPEYQHYVGRLCTVTGYGPPSKFYGVMYIVDCVFPQPPEGPYCTRQNLKPWVPPPNEEPWHTSEDKPELITELPTV